MDRPSKTVAALALCHAAVFSLALALSACGSGSSEHTADPSGANGIVYGMDGRAVAGAAVTLVTLDDGGAETSVIASAVSDGGGMFRFEVPALSNASVAVVAHVGGRSIRGFYAETDGVVAVDPVSNALLQLLVEIADSERGRTLSDFSPSELRALLVKARGLDWSTIDLDDDVALRARLREKLGRAIANSAGGTVSVAPSDLFIHLAPEGIANFAVNQTVCPLGAPIWIGSGDAFQFDIEEDGSLCGGTGGGVGRIFSEGALRLRLPGETFFFYGGDGFPDGGHGSSVIKGGREIFLGPHPLLAAATSEGGAPVASAVTVERRIMAAETDDYVRYLDIFRNEGSVDKTLSQLKVASFLATGNTSALLTFDRAQPADGNDASGAVPSLDDRFVVAYDAFGDGPSAAFIYQDVRGHEALDRLDVPGVAGGSANEVAFEWLDVLLPAGEIRVLMYFVVLSASRSAAEVHGLASALAEAPDMRGMTTQELRSLINFAPSMGSVMAEAGTVVGGAIVVATNQNYAGGGASSAEAEGRAVARRDGSFEIAIDARPGDTLQLECSDGWTVTRVVP